MRSVVRGGLTIGRFMSFRSYLRKFYLALDALTDIYKDMHYSLVASERYFELIDRNPNIQTPQNKQGPPETLGALGALRTPFGSQAAASCLDPKAVDAQGRGPHGAPSQAGSLQGGSLLRGPIHQGGELFGKEGRLEPASLEFRDVQFAYDTGADTAQKGAPNNHQWVRRCCCCCRCCC